ncbi:ABC transporter substrate-binding protein [Actinokineospora globicatena]|uniref:ABC transporter substrate-binding protein n=1 Tax=Actinokineospora globicatena TaxID=103729 RepID=UPI0020A58E31|nr:ABC transporter substrate-binding protein [Actinokineospora globicatena]MCP2305846.1 amino acid/amide ABC transporter substrate-binding protein, HAAT family [Actinokineospora globicatena]GLW80287.1 nitrile hydratase regulator [Actinokineospora globicatena]GLW87116.1 nitrile hydratase regulator [Actinokineospora globicatena]
MDSTSVVRAVVRDRVEVALTGPDPAVLRLGLLLPLSGALGLTGPSGLMASTLAATELNTAGGVVGRPVQLVLLDAGQAPAVVAADAIALAGLVDAYVGFHTSDVHRALEIALGGRVPYIFTPPHEGGRRRAGVVLLGDSPTQQLAPAVRWLVTRRGARRWALVGSDYIWPRAVHQAAGRIVRALGAEVVAERLVPFPGTGIDAEAIVTGLGRLRADAILLSLVGRDLAQFNRVFAASPLASRVVRLSGSLEENGLLAAGGDDTGELYAAMRSFAGQGDDRRMSLAERHRALFGGTAPVLDAYAEACYDGVHLAAALAAVRALTPDLAQVGTVRLLTSGDRMPWSGAPLGPPRAGGFLARATGLDLTVIAPLSG